MAFVSRPYTGAIDNGDTANAELLNSCYMQSGLLADRPAAGNNGVTWVDSQNLNVYRDNGTEWIRLTGASRRMFAKEFSRNLSVSGLSDGLNTLTTFMFTDDLNDMAFVGDTRLYISFATPLPLAQPAELRVTTGGVTYSSTIQPVSGGVRNTFIDFVSVQPRVLNQTNTEEVFGGSIQIQIISPVISISGQTSLSIPVRGGFYFV